MGAFFSNFHLKNPGIQESALMDKIIECIVDFNLKKGFIRVDNENDADNSVVILPSNKQGWLAIYDEEMNSTSRGMNKLTLELSEKIQTIALSVLVSDSDSVHILLSADGNKKDVLSNLHRKDIVFTQPNPEEWSNLLINNHSFEDIKNAWYQRDHFVEDFLSKFSTYIGIDPSKILTGYDDLHEINPSNEIKLYFAKKDKKAPPKLGLTKFELISGAGLLDMKLGEKLEAEWVVTNHGKSSEGVDIVISGECIDKDLFIPDTVTVTYIKYDRENRKEYIVPFIKSVSTTGGKIYYARFEDLFVPEGTMPVYPMSSREYKRYVAVWHDSAISFTISLVGQKAGAGAVYIFFSPFVNRQEGTYSVTHLKGNVSE